IRPRTRPEPRTEASGSSGATAGPATRVRPEPSYYDRGGRPASLHGRAPASRSSDDFSGREPGQEVTQRQDEHTILPVTWKHRQQIDGKSADGQCTRATVSPRPETSACRAFGAGSGAAGTA